MNKTKIPWADYTVNPVKGLCPMACPYCYAHRMYKRFKWNPEIRFDHKGYADGDWGIVKIKKPAKIFVGSTMELFGDWIGHSILSTILQITRRYPQHTCIMLTKQPQSLAKYSAFPPNAWVGVSCTDEGQYLMAYHTLPEVQATVKFLSFEPLLKHILVGHESLKRMGAGWLILGSQTQPTRHPERAWVEEIIAAADSARIPVFVKEPMASHFGIFRQEFPMVERTVSK